MRRALAVALCVLAATGCGGGKSVANPFKHLKTPTNFRFEMRIGSPDDSSQQVKASGVVDDAKHAIMTEDFTTLVGSQGDRVPAKPVMEIRLLGAVAYFHAPFLASRIPAYAHWIEIPAAKVGGSSMNPTGTSSSLDKATNVALIGADDVRGVATTHYTGELELSKISQIPGSSITKLKALGVDRLPFEAWIDQAQRPRRITVRIESSGGSAEVDMQFFDFGAHAKVEPPPASDTTMLPTLPGLPG